jgi:GTP-binding protein
MRNPKKVSVNFLKSGVMPGDYPLPNRPEIAIAGRSNAGKSSFINSIAKTAIARISQEPGKTRTLNFFDVGEHYRIVDMPGYGFAARGGDEQTSWEDMVETYLNERENLVGLILLIDSRREWTSDEEMLIRFSQKQDLPVAIGMTKADQVKTQELKNKIQAMKKSAKTDLVWATSSRTGDGIPELERYVFDNWVKGAKS